MRSVILLSIFFIGTSTALAQKAPGYLGKRWRFDISGEFAPSFKKKVSHIEGRTYKVSPRVLHPNMMVSAYFTASRMVEIGMGYRMEYAYLETGGNRYQNYSSQSFGITEMTPLQDIRAIGHVPVFTLRFHTKGNLAPIGNYIGLNFMTPIYKVKQQVISGGVVDNVNNVGGSYFSRSILGENTYYDGIIEDVEIPEMSKVGVGFGLSLGKVIPITPYMAVDAGINVQVRFPFMGDNTFTNSSSYGTRNFTNGGKLSSFSEEFILQEAMAHQVHAMMGLELRVGISFLAGKNGKGNK